MDICPDLRYQDFHTSNHENPYIYQLRERL